MVLPLELIDAIKERASRQGLSITAYVTGLVRRDLGLPVDLDPSELAQQLQQLQARVDQLERHDKSDPVDLM